MQFSPNAAACLTLSSSRSLFCSGKRLRGKRRKRTSIVAEQGAEFIKLPPSSEVKPNPALLRIGGGRESYGFNFRCATG
jgi:hypothetical protein